MKALGALLMPTAARFNALKPAGHWGTKLPLVIIENQLLPLKRNPASLVHLAPSGTWLPLGLRAETDTGRVWWRFLPSARRHGQTLALHCPLGC
jgi:hypothetical protein